MACSSVANNFRVKIKVQVSRRHKVLLKFSAESLVQSGEDVRRIIGVSSLAGKSDLEHGRDERSGNPMPGDVRYENAKLIASQRKKIVEIASDSTHWPIMRCNLKTSEMRYVARKNRCLN